MTPREMAGFRRASDLAWYWQLIHFLGAPLVDHWRGLSLTRAIAVFCAVCVGHEVFVRKLALTWIDFSILVLAVGTAFGKMTYEAFLKRLTLGVAGAQTQTTVDATVREIQERRGNGTFEATP